MTALACMAMGAALLVAPGSPQGRRLRAVVTVPSTRSMPRYIPVVCVAAGAAAALVAALATVGSAAVAAAAIVLSVLTAGAMRGKRESARRAEIEHFSEALDSIIAELRVGAHPALACAAAARSARGITREMLSRAAGRARLGADISSGFLSTSHEGFARQAGVAWRIAERHGAGLADLLATVRGDLRARVAFEKQLRAGLGGARATSAMLAALPLVGVGIGELMGAAPLKILITTELGGALLIAGAVLVAIGLQWTARIVDGVRY